jgi:hypothetical protein
LVASRMSKLNELAFAITLGLSVNDDQPAIIIVRTAGRGSCRKPLRLLDLDSLPLET